MARLQVRNCKNGDQIARGAVESGAQPTIQHELCPVHADQVAQREKLNGREILRRAGGEVRR